jgi:calcineurin-like phosphoesterase family protein
MEFLSSDLHFDHGNIILHCQRKPWIYPNPNFNPNKPEHFKYNNPNSVNLKEHNDALISNWNSMVKKGDKTIIAGDFAYSNHNHFLAALNGKKILVTGNHDKANQEFYRNFTEVHEMGCRKRIDGKDITICHYAMRSWASSFHGSYLAYGHSHGRMPEFNNMLCCDIGVDIWGYSPVPFDAFLKKMQIKEEWIKKNGKYPVDGENKAEGQYDKDPDQRVIEIRKQNKEIMRSLGYPIVEEMWPNT